MDYLKHFSEMIALTGLRDSTRRTYTTYISAYLNFVETVLLKTPEDVSWDEKRQFIVWIQKTRGISDRTVNYVIAQLRFFTIFVLHSTWDKSQLPYRRFDRYIPFVPTRAEIAALIRTIHDHKARTMIIIAYSSGLRISEVCNLRYEDISRQNHTLHITRGKNREDRYALLPDTAVEALTRYWRIYGGSRSDYIFRQKRDPSKPVSTGFIRGHILKAEEALGWSHRFTSHTFRRAFGTHFYEDHRDILALQRLLGHRSLRSTEVYVNLSNESLRKYPSPVESLGLFEVSHGK